jgi:hypothetical protein
MPVPTHFNISYFKVFEAERKAFTLERHENMGDEDDL